MSRILRATYTAASLVAVIAAPLPVSADQLSGEYLVSDADIAFFGSEAFGNAGFSVSSAGDVNGDGFDDLLISAPFVGRFPGETYLIYGSGSGGGSQAVLRPSDADVRFVGAALDYSGYSVSSAGDINSDGLDDLLISTANRSGGPSKAYLVYGRSDANQLVGDFDLTGADASFVLNQYSLPGRMGLSPAGDVDGDGAADLLIGVSWYDQHSSLNAGQSFLFYGDSDAPFAGEIDLTSADATFPGDISGGFLGYAVSNGGDLNQDGLDDLVISAVAQSEVFLIYGRPTSDRLAGPIGRVDADAVFGGVYGAGRSLATSGDLNGDGLTDLVIGASNVSVGGKLESGAAYLLLGSPGAAPWSGEIDLNTADVVFEGVEAGDEAGYRVSTAGDVNGDGIDDLLIGAHQAQGDPDSFTEGQQGGKAYLIYGGTDGLLDDAVYSLADADAVFIGGYRGFIGSQLDSSGDFNGDGLADILLGSYPSPLAGQEAGAAYIFYGQRVPEPATLTIASVVAAAAAAWRRV